MEIDLDFDITVTGFDIGDIDFIIEGADKAEAGDPLDEVPEPKDQAVTRLGDIWAIGPHRLICGDARNAETYRALLRSEEHTSELQSLMRISYAVFCLKTKTNYNNTP